MSGFVYNPNSKNSLAVKKIQKLCDQFGIKLFIVLPPFYNNSMYNKKETQSMLNDFKVNNIKYIINMSDITKYPQLNQESLWRDSTHFSSKGADMFSIFFADELKKK
jgi:hypothetical protein